MPNTSPVANDDDLVLGTPLYQLNEDTFLSVSKASGVLANDTDADPSDANTLAAAIVSGGLPENPLFTFKTNGAFTYDARYHGDLYVDPTTGELVDPADIANEVLLDYGFNSLAVGAVVYDTFQYAATDGLASDTATAYVYITGVNDAPVAADDDAGNVAQGGMTTIDAVFNDTDVDTWPNPDILTVTSLTDINDGYGGTTGGTGTSILTDAGGTVQIIGGQVQYTAAAEFVGIDTISYVVSDGNGGSDTGVIRFTVLGANQSPVAQDDTYTIGEGASATTFTSVLLDQGNGADSDPDNEPLGTYYVTSSLTLIDDGSLDFVNTDPGTLDDFNADGTFTYDPNGNTANNFNYLKAGETAIVQFQYTAFDGLGLEDTATVTIEITGANDPPGAPSGQTGTVYEAGLLPALGKGSTDGSTTIVQTFDFDLTGLDPDGDPLHLVNSSGTTTSIVGTRGTLAFIDADTVQYTLTSSATHAAPASGADHNSTAPGGLTDILDSFSIYVSDGTAMSATSTSVDVTVVDDIPLLGPDGPNAVVGNDLDNGMVAFTANASNSDAFTFIPGADGASLQFTGKPNNFTLIDGRTIVSNVSADGLTITGVVQGTTNNFYTLVLSDPTPGDGLWTQTFTLLQGAPSVENPIDFSSISAGGPQEEPLVENIRFDGGFWTPGPDNSWDVLDIWKRFDDRQTSNVEDINPNNAGGIGIGNGNIERGEVLSIDTRVSPANETGVSFILQGNGGGVSGVVDVLWVATKFVSGVETFVASGTKTTTNINASKTFDLDGDGRFETNGEKIVIEPGAGFAFDRIYVALDGDGPNGIDSNDSVRINNIATIEQQNSPDIILPFSLRGNEGAIDGDVTQEESFTWTIDGPSTDPAIMPGEFDLLI